MDFDGKQVRGKFGWTDRQTMDLTRFLFAEVLSDAVSDRLNSATYR